MPGATAAVASPTGVDIRHVAADSALALVLRPAQAAGNPVVQGVIREIEAANPDFKLSDRMNEMREQLGVDLNDIEHVLVVVDQQTMQMIPMLGMMFLMGGQGGPMMIPDDAPQEAVPQDPGTNCDDLFAPDAAAGPDAGPPAGGPNPFDMPPPTVVVKFKRAIEAQKLIAANGGAPEERTHGGQKYYVKSGDKSAAWFPDTTTAILAAEMKVQQLIDGQTGEPGPLGQLLAPLVEREIALVLDVRPLHELIGQVAQGNPAAAMAGGLVKQVNTLTLAADLQGSNLLQLQLHALDENSAAGLQGMLSGLLQQGQAAFAQQMQQNADQIPEHDKALVPLMEKLVNGGTVTAEGAVCSVTITRPENLEQLPEIIRPSLQHAMQAAAAARELNSLKQIAIAFHNYHDVFGKFPARSGGSSPEAPGAGLSWRVHLLPYVDEFQLYQEFNLDEPWDSEHNQALIARMPAIYGDDSEGKSRLHVIGGEGAPFQGTSGLPISEITDGTSNTILVVEAGPSTADVWTKPGALELNAADPLAVLGDVGESFNVAFMDGSCRKLPRSIDAETLKYLIQHADGHPVNIPE